MQRCSITDLSVFIFAAKLEKTHNLEATVPFLRGWFYTMEKIVLEESLLFLQNSVTRLTCINNVLLHFYLKAFPVHF